LVCQNRQYLVLYYEPKRVKIVAMKIRIITDDFSSATDGLPAFAGRGWDAAVALEPTHALEVSVVSVDTDSRLLPAALAARAVRAWAAVWKEADILVKQFDSTLRGPLVAEVAAAWHASGRCKLLVAPAFPEAGRTVVNGHVLVDDVPVHRTPFATDPLNPVREDNVQALFAEQGIMLTLAANAQQAVSALNSSDAVLVDATTREDMESLVKLVGQKRDLMWAGSTGLLRAMAQTLPAPRAFLSVAAFAPCTWPLIVVGSQHPRSRAQYAFAKNAPCGVLSLSTPNVRSEPAKATMQLVDQVVALVHAGQCDGMVVTGGETAKQIAKALNAKGISVLREVEAGIPLCVLHMPTGDFPMITKAGGFGDEHVFMRCVAVLRGNAKVLTI
jgi:D-threonate/D-erythronate kinase